MEDVRRLEADIVSYTNMAQQMQDKGNTKAHVEALKQRLNSIGVGGNLIKLDITNQDTGLRFKVYLTNLEKEVAEKYFEKLLANEYYLNGVSTLPLGHPIAT